MKDPRTIKRRTLGVGFLAVLVPLLVLLALQYRWLVKITETSDIVHQATLDNYLEAVSAEVEYYYRTTGERTLNIPATVFTQGLLEKAAHHFKKKRPEGVKGLFVMSFVDGKWQPLFFEPSCDFFNPPSWSPETRAVWVAVAPWKTLSHKQGVLEHAALDVEERDPENRILLNPITDDSSRLVGVAGMILDPEHFEQSVLPAAVDKSLPKFFSEDRGQDPIVSVIDGDGRLAFATGQLAGGGRTEAEKAFSFVFTDWRIGLKSRHATPGQLARRNFVLNLALSVLLAAVVLAGLALALRTAAREMKLSEMKSDFVSNVSHELRTPLASIRVFGEFLRLGRVESGEKIREYGDYIETESRRLTQLINNILDFASIESGRKSYRFERADVEELVAETLKTFGVRLRQNGFRITFERPASPLPPVRLDPGGIAQSLSNLLDNAVKYSNGARDITVALRQEGGSVVISVKDQGIGIPKDDQKKIFDRFHRVSTGLVHDVKGSGLGLSIVQHIVEAHRGRVTVESRPGEGSTFSIHLPVDPPGLAAEPEGGVLAPSQRPSGA